MYRVYGDRRSGNCYKIELLMSYLGLAYHEPCIAVERFINKFLGLPEARRSDYESKQAPGHKALAVMDTHLETRSYFVNDALTIADVSLYAYTHVAHEGGFDLAGYPAVRAWLNRVAEHPRHLPMSDAPARLADGADARCRT